MKKLMITFKKDKKRQCTKATRKMLGGEKKRIMKETLKNLEKLVEKKVA